MTQPQPWYKQFWPWFLIILPGTVVVACITTFVLFVHNDVDLVAEDYYKKGKAINVDLSKIKVAQNLSIFAKVRDLGDTIEIQLDKGKLEHNPAIKAIFTHRTLPDRDFSKILTSDAKSIYRIQLDEPLTGPWFIELLPHDSSWMIQGRINFPTVDFFPLGK
ncbi:MULTISPECIES: FixH family protein [Aliivibrio]|jgi:hypothetical protein|uniref:Nitrogen fixation protein FixH n=3 Tax=Aliivibrio TaxID=511678 RepID=A0A1B9P0D0_ALILO|nr:MULTISPECIES: FixH family protein [Aliivibrio]AZL84822.1 hypothetical protein EIJ81_09540 [Aliivibrio salmonicida]MBB1315297.1 FixH family protein [Aliivibrio sp. SR45-2]OCH21809.1 hypothetical protein A6E04_08075 [Aliivibrio logei]OEF10778.1 hypothetical protein A1Q5_13130 [Aliivibrio logei 5S-186]CAQ79252.1 putative membrane protein [Aliivibrio salmonicida LFI1238]